MKRFVIAAVLAAVSIGFVLPATAQTGTDKVEFASYWVVYAEHGPTWLPQTDEQGMKVRMQVVEALKNALINDHEVIIAGLVDDGSDAEFIIILQTEDEWGMRKTLNNSPNVANGFYNLKIHSFQAPAGLNLKMVPRK